MLEPFTGLIPSVEAIQAELHVVTVSDRSTELLYEALLDSGEHVLRLDSQATLSDLFNAGSQNEAKGEFSSLHLYSHGESGRFWIGGTEISIDSITGLQGQLGQLGELLDNEGDMLIYGCDVAKDQSGKTLIQRLGNLTGADVAASVDATGNSATNQNWKLEYHSGSIEEITAAPYLEQLQPRLTLATGQLSTLVSVVDDSEQDLLAASSLDHAIGLDEGASITASVKLRRRPDAPVRVSFATSNPMELRVDDERDQIYAGSLNKFNVPPVLVFERTNWNIAQTFSIQSLEDGAADGTFTLPVRMSIATAGRATAAKTIWIDSLDSGAVNRATTPESGRFSGTLDRLFDTKSSSQSTSTVSVIYDGSKGTASFRVTSTKLANVRDSVIEVDYTINSENTVDVEAVRGFSRRGLQLDLHYIQDNPNGGYGPWGLSGLLTLTQPMLGKTDTFIVTAMLEESVDINQYAGTWYEQGSVKQFSTARLVNTTARYTPQLDGSVQVVNTSRYGSPSGPVRQSIGSAIIVDDLNTQWHVSCSGSHRRNSTANYSIVDFAPDYSWAIASDPLGRNVVILTRDNLIDNTEYEMLARRAAWLGGVDISKITRTRQFMQVN